jgi:WD40 repeat protein
VSGNWLFSGDADQTVKQWNITTSDHIATFDNNLCAKANIKAVQGLTPAQIDSLLALGAVQ